MLKGFSILLVLFIHANITDCITNMDMKSAIGLYTQVVTRILVDNAVPMFFFVSGFLFFLKSGSYMDKWKKRLYSLVIPYILWCLVGFFIPFILQVVFGLDKYFSGNELKKIAEFESLDYLRIFWDIRNGSPILSVMWFLRNLIVMVALTPIIGLLCDKLKWVLPLILTGVYLFLPFSISGISSLTLFWFGIGCYVAKGGGNIWSLIENINGKVLFVFWIVMLGMTILSFYYDMEYDFVHNIFMVIHFVSIYKVLSILSQKYELKTLKKIAGISFFIYAFHEPWLGYIMKLSFKIIPFSGILLYLAPFIFVAVAVAYSYVAYMLLWKFAPRILKVLTGSR